MTETLSVAYLLGALSETCEARDGVLKVNYAPSRERPWTVVVHGRVDPVLRGGGATAQEALASTWTLVQRHCREAATRGPG